MLLRNSLCMDMTNYEELEYLNKVTIGTYSCVNYLSPHGIDSIVIQLHKYLNKEEKT
jgi:hypothetical protein